QAAVQEHPERAHGDALRHNVLVAEPAIIIVVAQARPGQSQELLG
ncbi:MAG: hypothetical protein ACI9MC_003063, partial [Kiritimatiellia bacterium]